MGAEWGENLTSERCTLRMLYTPTRRVDVTMEECALHVEAAGRTDRAWAKETTRNEDAMDQLASKMVNSYGGTTSCELSEEGRKERGSQTWT